MIDADWIERHNPSHDAHTIIFIFTTTSLLLFLVRDEFIFIGLVQRVYYYRAICFEKSYNIGFIQPYLDFMKKCCSQTDMKVKKFIV